MSIGDHEDHTRKPLQLVQTPAPRPPHEVMYKVLEFELECTKVLVASGFASATDCTVEELKAAMQWLKTLNPSQASLSVDQWYKKNYKPPGTSDS